MNELRKTSIKITGGEIPIVLYGHEDDEDIFYTIEIDDVEWLSTTNQTHAVVMFELMKDHITEYMYYEKI